MVCGTLNVGIETLLEIMYVTPRNETTLSKTLSNLDRTSILQKIIGNKIQNFVVLTEI